jgi:hypothetical protein
MKNFTCLCAAAALALSLAACSKKDAPEPQNETTGAMMPDTDAAAGAGDMTAPDAGDTGTIPMNGAAPPVHPEPVRPDQNAPSANTTP